MSISALTRDQAASADWLVIGHANQVPLLEGRRVEIGGKGIAVFHLPDGWAAIDQVCPHRGGPLSDGIVAESCVTCPLHNQRFSLRSGERQDASGEGLRTYTVREREGVLELLWPAA